MNPLDETLLTAYLDDELDPDDRAAIETALLSQPDLARRLRELTQARDAIRAASRPELRHDVAASVVARLRFDRDRTPAAAREAPAGTGSWAGDPASSARILRFFESSKLNRIAVWAAAALLLIASGLWQLPGLRNHNDGDDPGLTVAAPAPAPDGRAGLNPDALSPSPKTAAKPAQIVALNATPDAKAKPCDDPPNAKTPGPSPARPPVSPMSPHDQELQRWLKDRQPRILTASLGDPIGSDAKRVERLLSETSLNACRFAVIIDESAKSAVIALQIQGEEWDRVRQSLDQAFPRRFQEIAPQPRLIALAHNRPARFVEIVAPRDAVLKPSPASAGPSVMVIQHPEESEARARVNPFDEPLPPEPVPAPASAPALAPPAEKSSLNSGPSTVLIILTADETKRRDAKSSETP